MSTTSTALMTAEELMQLPRGYDRAELINGELITMPLPKLPHARAATRLGGPLVQFVEDHDLGEVYIGDVGYQLTWNPDTVLGPDISFTSKQRLNEIGEVEGYGQGPPDLAVEVRSPGDRRGKVNKKISLWLGSGAKQVWIVEPKHRTVTVYRSETDATTFSGSDYLEAQDLFPGFRLSLGRIFGPTPGMVEASK
jgi:Uma2 family endonuclease